MGESGPLPDFLQKFSNNKGLIAGHINCAKLIFDEN